MVCKRPSSAVSYTHLDVYKRQALGCLLAMKLVAMLQFDMLHAIESPHKVEMPIAAAELAIGDIRDVYKRQL